ncbi:hypothetical protein JCGZ_18957 [Jatropha curcas]|uniref:Transmembrane protein n=1 Tax=Jatropha curcas TaxID=180498 RepID=A0A067JVG2_JATCU|nr:uncharacterized protein LOC105643501 [Jatropha curcas]KDP27877.1 hypothetical protein JCGZ_18957 [Jatropha curcas]
MPPRKAITHADLAPGPRSTDLSSKTAVFLMVLTILSGLFCFVLCLIAEATHSQVTWVAAAANAKRNGENYECVYSGSGKTPLLCAAIAFVGIAVAMVVEHMYMLIAISKAPPPALLSWDSNCPVAKNITWQAGFFFVATWLCFAVGEILLLIGLSVESGHLKNWSKPRPSCLIIKQGLFSAAGVLSLLTVFFAAGLYITALRAQRISQEQENLRRQILEASALYATPPPSPPPQIIATARENPIARERQTMQPPFIDPPAFSKNLNLV